MTDVIFLLLIYFLLNQAWATAPVAGIVAEIPTEKSAVKIAPEFILQITNQARYILNQDTLALAQISSRLKAGLKEAKYPFVLLQAERHVTYTQMIEVAQIIQKAGGKIILTE